PRPTGSRNAPAAVARASPGGSAVDANSPRERLTLRFSVLGSRFTVGSRFTAGLQNQELRTSREPGTLAPRTSLPDQSSPRIRADRSHSPPSTTSVTPFT